ncbi:MAG: hypothetical protein PHS79_05075 [Patescibacteria group bacterium]|nr:hypothetical protein [Patescibacteria group bacterium]
MLFKINGITDKKLNAVYEKSMRELDSFFDLGWEHGKPNVVIVPDRKTINALKGKATEAWVVGWGNGKTVYILSDKNFEKESSHKYSDDKYFALLKHELAHCFSHLISKSAQKPVWLLEGIAIFLSGQLDFKTKPEQYLKFIDFYESGGAEVYSEAGFVVEFLVEKHGKEKILELLKRASESDSKDAFAHLFKSIYDFELSYNNFNRGII